MKRLSMAEIRTKYPWVIEHQAALEAKGYEVDIVFVEKDDETISLKFKLSPAPQIDLVAMAASLRADGMDVELTDEGLTATK